MNTIKHKIGMVLAVLCIGIMLNVTESKPTLDSGSGEEVNATVHLPSTARIGLNTKSPILSLKAPEIKATPIKSALGPEMVTFGNLRKKALLTGIEKREFLYLRHNRGIMNQALKQVLESDLPTSDRQEIVAYLVEAISDQENPEAGFLVGQMEQVILAENLHANLPQEVRYELAADKGELILSYLSARPDRLAFLLSASANSPNGKVLQNVVALTERRRAESLRIIAELDSAVSK